MRKRNFFAAASFILCLLLLSFPAQAAFSFKEKSADSKTLAARLGLTGNNAIVLTQIGGPDKTESKQSRGNDVLIPLAIELISPDEWTPIVGDELKNQKVSWQSGPDGDWVKTLEGLGKKESLRFIINWNSQEIIAGASGKNWAQETASIPKIPWKLEPGSLKKQLSRWADRAGYRLIWDNQYDYRLDAGQTFYGKFAKAVNEAITTLYRNGARIQADIYTKNQVLYISGGPEK